MHAVFWQHAGPWRSVCWTDSLLPHAVLQGVCLASAWVGFGLQAGPGACSLISRSAGLLLTLR